jgi:two-component system heavy metal sensor histidine kinase CusS
MSLKPTEPRSIASQLVLFFTLAAALLLSCGLGVFYWMVVRHAFEEDNAVLADKIFALRAELNKTGPSVLAEESKNPQPGEHVAYWIRVIDSQGRTVNETPGMGQVLPPAIFPEAQSPNSSLSRPKDFRTGAKLFSLLTMRNEASAAAYTIQVAQDRSADEQFRKEFGALLAAVLAGGLIAAAAIAITVTKRGLRPLAEMTRSLERVGPGHLHERVPPAAWPRELRPLAVAFDNMLERLEDSFTRLSQFSADLAHELRTPIANMLGEAQVTLTRERSSEEYREVIESSVAECERLSGIVDNLLFLARAESADRQIHPTLFGGRPAIEKIAAYYETIAEDRHVSIRCTGEGQIYADPVLFARAVSNLVDNALRFTPNSGSISISISMRDAHSEISVSDTGCGIPPEHLARVFDRFYRADSSRSSEGVGLGLALVKSIADLHGGSARLDSQVNQGTTVILTFPKPAKGESAA